jgi:choline dehydrogenase-like flavoprotein
MSTPSSSQFDAIVVGTGPGGASVARELAMNGARVLMLEQGGAEPLRGSLVQMAGMAAVPGKGAFIHRDASLLVRAITLGGSSAINFATAAPPPTAMFAAHGIDLGAALAELRAELPMAPLPDSLVGPMAARIMEAARALSLDWRKLDKMIRPESCRSGCWRCVTGCPSAPNGRRAISSTKPAATARCCASVRASRACWWKTAAPSAWKRSSRARWRSCAPAAWCWPPAASAARACCAPPVCWNGRRPSSAIRWWP